MSDAARIAMMQREVKLRRERLALKKASGIEFYRPHPKQDAFHRAGAFKNRMVRAGNRFGKSQMGGSEDVGWLLGERPWYPITDPARYVGIPKRPVKGLVIAADWDKVDEIFTSQAGDRPGKIWQLLPRGFAKRTTRNHSGTIDMIECQNGSVIRFDTIKSFLGNQLGSESSDWDFIHVDEPCPEAMFKASARGLVDRGGSCWFTLTPLAEMWINDKFFGEETNHETHWAETGSMFDNPYLTPEAIAAFEELLTDDEKQCRLYGVPLELAGLVYKNFNRDVHVLNKLPIGWANWQSPPHDYTIHLAIDPHPQTPHAVLFCAVNQFGSVFFYDEIFEKCSIQKLAGKILEKTSGRFVATQMCDPLGFIEHPITNTSMSDEFDKCGLNVTKAPKNLSGGIINAQSCLDRKGYIYVCPSMKRFLWEINRYSWKQGENKPVDKDDHMMENFYRLLLSEPIYIDQSHNNSQPISDMPVESFHTGMLQNEDLVNI